MALPYSTQFLRKQIDTARDGASYFVPTGYRAIVRSIVVHTETTTPQEIVVYLMEPGGAFCFLYKETQTTPYYASLEMHQVGLAGDSIAAYVDLGTAWVGVGGYLLTE